MSLVQRLRERLDNMDWRPSWDSALMGATGVILGGGLGWLSGLYGACCDNLLSARIVTADAQTLDVDETTEPDLFWALARRGANFGVTTNFEARLYPIQSVLGGDIHFAVGDARAVLRGFSDLMRDAPDGSKRR